MGFLNRFERTERILLSLGSAGLIICLSLFFLIDKYSNENILNQSPEVGSITAQENDTRHKSNGSFVWYPSRADQPIRIGDSIFSGEKSKTRIKLKNGGELTITENSLVRFREVEKQNIADLETGNFVLKVDGTLKVSVNGTITELEGKDSEVQIKITKKSKPQVRLIKGQAKVKKAGKPSVHLETNRVAVIEPEAKPKPQPKPAPKVTIATKTAPPTVIPEEAPIETIAEAELDFDPEIATEPQPEIALVEPEPPPAPEAPKPYFYKLYDVYEQRDFQLFERELADADPLFLEGVAPSASVMSAEIVMPFESVTHKVELSAPIEALGYVVQAGQNSSFAVGNTRTFWSASPELNLSFYQPGVYYYRFRTVNKNQELSEWSETARFSVNRPPLPKTPELIRARNEGYAGEKFFAVWKSEGVKTAVELTDQNGVLLKTRDSNTLQWRPAKSGAYFARAFAVDKYGRWSPPTQPVEFKVKEVAAPIAPLAKKEEPPPQAQEPEREVATQEESPSGGSQLKIEPLIRERNHGYRESKLSLEGFSWAMMSSQQYYQKQQAPIAAGAGLRAIKWFKSAGLEGRYKTAVFGVNEAGRSNKLQDIEARAHYRTHTRFPFGLFRELQISGFGGYEMYRNSGEFISNQYDLIKFGTSLQFPLGQRWATGGEFGYGLGTDSSRKMEMSGHIDYFFNKTWAWGFGYRVHLFEAGSAKTAPGGFLPYREGYTEGYSVIDYHF